MRLPMLVFLTLLCFSTTYSQPKPVVQDKGTFGLHVFDDAIRQHKYLEQENLLLLVGWKSYQLLDLSNFNVFTRKPSICLTPIFAVVVKLSGPSVPTVAA